MSKAQLNNIGKNLEKTIQRYKYSEIYSSEFLDYIHSLLKKGHIDMAVKEWNSRTPKDMLYVWGKTMQDYMAWAVDDLRTPGEINLLSSRISITTEQVQNIMLKESRAYLTDVIGSYYKKIYNVGTKELYDTIINASVAQFETYINGALTNTPAHILNDIRQFQYELHYHHQALQKLDALDDYIDQVQRQFKARMKEKFPSYFQGMKDGKIIKSRWYGKNLDKVKTYTLDEYAEVMARPTIMNIDRATSLAHSTNAGHRVMDYVVLDSRTIKTDEERQICKLIMNHKTAGKALLALDDEAALMLGIKTITSAKQEGAMYIHCRHGIRPVSDEFNQEVEKILFLKQQMTRTRAG